MASFKSEGAYTPSSIMLGEYRARKIVIKSGAGVVAAGSVLGKITATGKYIVSLAAATDGSEVPDAILSEAVDATSADAEGVAYISGDVDQEKLILGAGHTLGSIDRHFRELGFFLIKAMG